MLISIVTIFPDLFAGVFDFGMIRQGRKKELLETEIVDLREFAPDERKTVDDRPLRRRRGDGAEAGIDF